VSEHREEHLDLCAGLALGSLADEDRKAIEKHLAEGCPQCDAALADFTDATVLLAASSPAAPVNPALRARVMAAVREAGTPERAPADRSRVIEMPRRRAPAWGTWAWAAAAAALAIVTGISWTTSSRLSQELEANRQELAQLQQRLVEEQRWAEVMSAPEARVAELQLTPDGLAALKARATYDPRTRNAVVVFENFTAPEGKDYELWALRGAGVASLGLIRADESGRAVMRLENVGDPDTLGGFAVSLEPAGGSPTPDKPTGPVVMVGKVAG
jgi:anti-sigma-K factor RskA